MANKLFDLAYRISPECYEFIRKIKYGHISIKSEWPLDKLIAEHMKVYKANHGHEFDIYNPVTFTEKVLWYETFYEGDGQLHRIEDKIEFKNYIEEKLGPGYTIPLLGTWTSIRQFRKGWKSLPEEFCLKSNLSYGGKNILFIHDKSALDYWTIEKEVREWLRPENTGLNSYGRAGWKATPKILAEEYKKTVKNQLFDFKFFCFDGKPYCVYAAVDHFGKDGSHISFYDLEWNKLDVTYGNHLSEPIQKPKHFDEMLRIAKTLSRGFPFVRVDFFETDDQLFVAEMTLYPGGGQTPYHPTEFDKELGDLFRLPIVNNLHSDKK